LKIRAAFAVLALLAMVAACSPDSSSDDFPVKADPVQVSNIAASAKAALSVKVDPRKAFDMPEISEEDLNAELKLSDAQISRFAQRGVISAYAEWCGFDAQNQSSLPFLVSERSKKELDTPNMTYAGLIMTLMMERTRTQLKEKGECPAETKAMVGKHIYKGVMDVMPADVTDPGKIP
jgi:hypothetical protein